MPRLPDVNSYGARPSLKTNRLDMPDRSGLMLADSLASAADTFTKIAVEKKAKDDRLNYALAKNEILQADIAQREKLREDEDWSTYDERYTNGFNTSRDDVFTRYRLSPSDSAMLAAESDLLRERGRINVADAARRVEIDEKASTLDAQLLQGRELVLTTDNATANEVMLSLLDGITAAKDEFLTDEQALAKSQAFVQDVSRARLEGMDPKLRQKELEATLASRKENGPITVDEIREDKGTGSIADFLTADVAKAMLEQTKKENELDTELETAIAIRDEAAAMYPQDSAAMMKYIRKATQGMDAKTRIRSEQLGRQISEERRVAENQERNDILISAGNLLTETDESGRPMYGFEDLPRDQLAKLSPGQYAELERFYGQLRNGEQFAKYTNWHREVRDKDGALVRPAYSTWADMSPEEKAKQDLTHPMWYTNFAGPQWKQMQDEQEAIKQNKSRSSSDNKVQTNDQILTDVAVGEAKFPRTGRSDSEDAAYQMMRSQMADEVARVQRDDYGGKEAPYEVRKDIARRLVLQNVWERDAGILGFVYGRDADTPVNILEVDPDDALDYFVPIEEVKKVNRTEYIGMPDENGMYRPEQIKQVPYDEYLKNLARSAFDGREPNQKDIENAYAQILIGGDPQEVSARVLAALKGKGEY